MRAPQQQTQTLLQGDYMSSDDVNLCLSTLLGSCVSVCLFDPVSGIGGMNHFLLPGDRIKFSNRKYGTHAMELLINQMLHKGASKATFQAKIFGGADMQNGLKNIGKLNADFARSFLKNEDIPIVAASLNGVHARRVRFWPGTGAAQQLKVPGMEMQADPLQIVRPSTRPRQRGAILFDDD